MTQQNDITRQIEDEADISASPELALGSKGAALRIEEYDLQSEPYCSDKGENQVAADQERDFDIDESEVFNPSDDDEEEVKD